MVCYLGIFQDCEWICEEEFRPLRSFWQVIVGSVRRESAAYSSRRPIRDGIQSARRLQWMENVGTMVHKGTDVKAAVANRYKFLRTET